MSRTSIKEEKLKAKPCEQKKLYGQAFYKLAQELHEKYPNIEDIPENEPLMAELRYKAADNSNVLKADILLHYLYATDAFKPKPVPPVFKGGKTSRFSADDVENIKSLVAGGMKVKDIAKTYNCCLGTIYHLLSAPDMNLRRNKKKYERR